MRIENDMSTGMYKVFHVIMIEVFSNDCIKKW